MSTAPAVVTAGALGLVACHDCGLTAPAAAAGHTRCRRCGAPLHRRFVNSYARAWAYLVAATILYIPANLLPMVRTSTVLGVNEDTIMSGVIELWQEGVWDMAIIVFAASIVVPILKIGLLSLLLVTARARSTWRQLERVRIYRMLEFIGHWSMLDIFVVALMVTLVQFQTLGEVQPGPAVVAFGAVVVLTMLASMNFDPRLIWDAEPRFADASDGIGGGAACPANDGRAGRSDSRSGLATGGNGKPEA